MIEFHNRFNRNTKVSFGALESISSAPVVGHQSRVIELPTGSEPWGRVTRWKNLRAPLKEAASFISELGISRSHSAFEDYLIGATAEFDRARLIVSRQHEDGASPFQRMSAWLGIARTNLTELEVMAEFFQVARNCVVHRSNRASPKLVELYNSPEIARVIGAWSKRVGRWTVSLPDIKLNHSIEWQPRHAIMSSDVFYRCAALIDQHLISKLGSSGVVDMAVHWTFFSEVHAACPAVLNPETMVRTQLVRRYGVRDVVLREPIDLLRTSGRWELVRAAYSQMFPDGPPLARLQRKRRAR
jgi:hypothetical protein